MVMKGVELTENFVVVDMPLEKNNPHSNFPENIRKSLPKTSNSANPVQLSVLQRPHGAMKTEEEVMTSNHLSGQSSQVTIASTAENTGIGVSTVSSISSAAIAAADHTHVDKEGAIKLAPIPLKPATTITGVQSENSTLLAANTVLSGKLATAEEDIQLLVQRLNETEASLNEAHDTIFNLQPYHQAITESDAAAEFAALHDNIESWLSTHLGDALDDRRLINSHSQKLDYPCASHLIALLTPAGKEAMQYPTTDEWNLTALIMRFLMHEVFDKELSGVAPASQLDFIHSLERSMACLEPRRDLSTTRSWLTTTLHALTSTPHYPTLLPPRLKILATTLTKILRLFSSNPRVTPPAELRSSILTAIVEPAVALAHRLHQSPNFYAVDFSPYAKKYEEGRLKQLPPIVGQLESFEAVDIMRAGRTVKVEEFVSVEEAQRTKDVTYVMDLCPGLFVQTVKGDVMAERRALRKPKIVVAITEKGIKQDDPNSFPPPFEEGEEGTLIAYLYSRVVERQRQVTERERLGLGWITRQSVP